MATNASQRIGGWSAVAAATVMIASIVLGLGAFGFNTSMSDPRADYYAALDKGSTSGYLLHLSMAADMLGYYLLLIPVALFLRALVRPANPFLADLSTSAAILYAVVGATGAAVLSAVMPRLIDDFATRSVASPEALVLANRTVVDAVYGGIWNTLEMIPFGVWLLGIGYLLIHKRRWLGLALIVLGVAGLWDALWFIIGVESIALISLEPLLLALPFVMLWIGLTWLLERSASSPPLEGERRLEQRG